MKSYEARAEFDKIDYNPSLDAAPREYDKLFSLMDKVIDALSECEDDHDNERDRAYRLQDDLNDATERIAELERQIEELSSKENS